LIISLISSAVLPSLWAASSIEQNIPAIPVYLQQGKLYNLPRLRSTGTHLNTQ
jgi:hypothetical protein